MVLTGELLARCLAAEVPETRALLRDHEQRWGYAGDPYLSMSGLQALALGMHRERSVKQLARLLDILADAFIEGDEDLRTAISNEFIGYLPPWTVDMQPFVETWPAVLRDEAPRITDHMTGDDTGL